MLHTCNSHSVHACVHAQLLSRAQLFVTLRTVAHQTLWWNFSGKKT